ncbi:MAG: sigma-70 family RNA polymerase sigma factor [Planctomycetota bacterium]
MGDPNPQKITHLLAQARAGDESSTSALLEAVYEELRRLAQHRMAQESPGLTLQATALVHEAYLRLVNEGREHWENRAHFFSAAAEAMRRILIERARRVGRLKRGGDRQRVALDAVEAPVVDEGSVDLLALEEALCRFEKLDPRRSQVVKLRYFVGLSVDETADALGVAPRTVNTDWNLARAWLKLELSKDRAAGAGEGES